MTDFEKCKVGDVVKSNTSGRIGKVQQKGLAWVLVEDYYILGTNVQLISAKESVTLDDAKKVLEDAGYTVTVPVVIPKFGQMYTRNNTGKKVVVVSANTYNVNFIWEGRTSPFSDSEPLSVFHTLFTLDN